MHISRRSVFAGAAAAATVISASGRDAGAQVAPYGPPPTADDLKDPKAFETFLVKRVDYRCEVMSVGIDADARPSIQELASTGAKAAFEEQRPGTLNKEKDYRVLPIPVRRIIVLRNLDTVTDLLIFSALAESKKVTVKIVSAVRDFVCPMYPFCRA